MKTYLSIDILRFFVALMVIAIHCGIVEININLFNLFTSFVPIFFVISGFFLDKNRMNVIGGEFIYLKV